MASHAARAAAGIRQGGWVAGLNQAQMEAYPFWVDMLQYCSSPVMSQPLHTSVGCSGLRIAGLWNPVPDKIQLRRRLR